MVAVIVSFGDGSGMISAGGLAVCAEQQAPMAQAEWSQSAPRFFGFAVSLGNGVADKCVVTLTAGLGYLPRRYPSPFPRQIKVGTNHKSGIRPCPC